MFNKVKSSPLFLVAGLVLLGIGGVNFYHLVIMPHLARLTGGIGQGEDEAQ